ncbi:MAG: hypothetical protein ACRDZ9_08780 [Acidimicrobiales bacterium]
MKAREHRAIGDAATGAAEVHLGVESTDGKLTLSFGDVVALSGDYFVPDSSPVLEVQEADSGPEALASGGLFGLAAVSGERGTRLGSRDEIVCALHVMASDESLVDPRFEPGGHFAEFEFSPTASETDVERRVRDRYLALGASNDDHFVVPGRRGGATAHDRADARFGSALTAYRSLHEAALEEAHRLGRGGGDLSQAMPREAAAQHYLTDAFASGHLRTPVAAIREFWQSRYPGFWESLQRKVASDTASVLRELAGPLRLLSARAIYDRTLSAVRTRTRGYPRVSLGDLLAKVFHDWDNSHGLRLEGGGVLFGDGSLDEGVTRDLVLAAVRAGIDDIEVAFALGASGKHLGGQPLYGAVRAATGAPADTFWPETKIPRLSPDNPPQNWQAADVGSLWDSPIVGSTGTTVGQAVTAALEAGEELPRRLDCLGHGIVDTLGLPPLPGLRQWISGKACQAYHAGFMHKLVHDSKATVFTVVEGAAPRAVAASATSQAVADR